MPYRLNLQSVDAGALDRLIELGAIDAEFGDAGRLAALMPDAVTPEHIAGALGAMKFTVSPAVGRDDGSVWILAPRPIHIGRLRIIPADHEPEPSSLRLVDSSAFGTGLHPTTALCVEAIEQVAQIAAPDSMLDVGTGSGILALAALMLGIPRALGIDTEEEALRVAAENARLNALAHRLQLMPGGPDVLTGVWPLIVANVLAAPLIEMASLLVRHVGHQGRLVLSGIPASVEQDVEQAYLRLGMRRVRVMSRTGWIALVLEASW